MPNQQRVVVRNAKQAARAPRHMTKNQSPDKPVIPSDANDTVTALLEYQAKRFQAIMVGTHNSHMVLSSRVLGREPEETLNFDQLRATMATTHVQ